MLKLDTGRSACCQILLGRQSPSPNGSTTKAGPGGKWFSLPHRGSSRSTPPFSKRMKSSRSPKTSDLTAFSGEQRQKRPRPVSGDGSRASVLPFPYPRVYRKGGRKGIQNPMATIVKRGIATNGARALLGALLALRLGTRSY